MSRPTLLVGIASGISRDAAARLEEHLSARVPHIDVVVVSSTSGMLLIPAPAEQGETTTRPSEQITLELVVDREVLASAVLRQDALAVDDQVGDTHVVPEGERDGQGDPGHDTGLGGAAHPQAGLALDRGGLNSQGQLSDLLVGAVGQPAEAGHVDVRHETSSRSGDEGRISSSRRTVEEPSDGTGEVASSPEPVPSGQGETATAPAGNGQVTIQISGNADPAEVGRRLTEYLDAYHRTGLRSRL